MLVNRSLTIAAERGSWRVTYAKNKTFAARDLHVTRHAQVKKPFAAVALHVTPHAQVINCIFVKLTVRRHTFNFFLQIVTL